MSLKSLMRQVDPRACTSGISVGPVQKMLSYRALSKLRFRGVRWRERSLITKIVGSEVSHTRLGAVSDSKRDDSYVRYHSFRFPRLQTSSLNTSLILYWLHIFNIRWLGVFREVCRYVVGSILNRPKKWPSHAFNMLQTRCSLCWAFLVSLVD